MLKQINNSFKLCRRNISLSTICGKENEWKMSKYQQEVEDDKARMQWRTPVADKPGEWYSQFKLFAPEEDTNSKIITMLQQPLDLSPTALVQWYRDRNVKLEKLMQQFIPQRHQILGNDLAAAHFVVYRGGSVRFVLNRCF